MSNVFVIDANKRPQDPVHPGRARLLLTAGKAAVSAAAGGEAVQRGWQYWTFMTVGLAATIIVTIWVTKIARDALKKTEDVK